MLGIAFGFGILYAVTSTKRGRCNHVTWHGIVATIDAESPPLWMLRYAHALHKAIVTCVHSEFPDLNISSRFDNSNGSLLIESQCGSASIAVFASNIYGNNMIAIWAVPLDDAIAHYLITEDAEFSPYDSRNALQEVLNYVKDQNFK